MKRHREIWWWQRILGALAATTFTVFACIALFVLQDLKQNPDRHWGNGGEEQVVGFFLLAGGVPLMITFLLIIVPLILLLPVRLQLGWWPAMMGFAALVPILIEAAFLRESPARIWHNVCTSPWSYAVLVCVAMSCCGEYLLLLQWLRTRR